MKIFPIVSKSADLGEDKHPLLYDDELLILAAIFTLFLCYKSSCRLLLISKASGQNFAQRCSR